MTENYDSLDLRCTIPFQLYLCSNTKCHHTMDKILMRKKHGKVWDANTKLATLSEVTIILNTSK
jgi:hypothetical protein